MQTTVIKDISNTIRGLSIDAINQANSGHPGLPLGCADIVSVLFTQHLQYNPKNPNWTNRDRFILSAGHGSMLLYSILHLSGHPISLDDIKNFRQLGYHTAGHPEYDTNLGIETTTGPLGQGIGHAVGLALAEKINEARFNTETHSIIDHTIYCLAGDGCLMEGVSAEVSSLAGHLNLNNLVLIYDSNDICLDGPIDECFTENVEKRYRSYGWDIFTVDGHDLDAINNTLEKAKNSPSPALVIAKTQIGYGSPNRANSAEAHGKALGEEEGKLTKEALGIPESPLFHVPDSVTEFFNDYQKHCAEQESDWQSLFDEWAVVSPKKKKLYDAVTNTPLPADLAKQIERLEVKPNLATRASSQAVIQSLTEALPHVIGGSADLSCSDSTFIKNQGIISKDDFSQRNIKYGVREFGMATIAAGLALSNTIRPFIGTFLTFSDYMKNGIRLAALMKLPVIYQFTHDSILLGEDGPTHQPVEHLASLRSIPDLDVIRPGDVNEVKGAWLHALQQQSPTAIILSRQGIPDLEESSIDGVSKGAYVLKEASNATDIEVAIVATGSELSLGKDVQAACESEGISTRLISFPSFECFDRQSQDYQNSILSKNIKHFVVIEAQSAFGWHKYVGRDATCVTVESFGLSAPAKDLANHFGFTTEAILPRIQEALSTLKKEATV